MKKKKSKPAFPSQVVVRAPVILNLPKDITLKELARVGWMLGVEFNFKVDKKRKRGHRAQAASDESCEHGNKMCGKACTE